jgi:hypothetical protein
MLTKSPRPASAIERVVETVLSLGCGFYARYAAPIGVALFSAYVLLTALTAWVLPDANWDMLAYIAAAGERDHPTPEAVHAYAYGTVRDAVSPADYLVLTDDEGGYRSHMATDPTGFYSMLPMYRVKFLFVEALSVLSTVMPPVVALHVLQVVAALLFGAVLLLWLRSARALALAPVLAALLMVAEFPYVSRSNSPDLLAAAMLLGGLYAHMYRREAATALLLLLAVLVRPDNVIFVGVFAVLLVALRQWSWGALVATVASFLSYFAIARWAGHPGWWPHLYFSSVEQQLNMQGFDPAFSILAYAKAFVNAVVRSLTYNTWVGVAVLALAGWYASDRAGYRLDKRAGIVFAALVLSVLAKFVLFPIHDGRIYFPYLIAPFMLLAPALTALFSERLGGGRTPATPIHAG